MAGSIHLSDVVMWSAGSHGFWPIIEMTRDAIHPENRESLQECFSPLDEGFVSVDLRGLDSVRFNCFVRATRAKYEEFRVAQARSETPDNALIEIWRELLHLLENDSRYMGKSVGPS